MRLRRKILITLGVVLGVAVIIPWIYHCRLQAVNEAYIAQLSDQGEPMTLAQVLPPPVPDSENSAGIFLQAATSIDADTSFLRTNISNSMLPVAPGKALAASQQADVIGSESTNSWAELAAALVQNQTALDLLQQLTLKPALDFHIHYEYGMGSGFDWQSLNLIGLKKSAQYLTAAIIHNLHDGNIATAVKNQRAMLVLAKALQNQRFIISELVGMVVTGFAQRSTWEILQSPGLTPDQLTTLQQDWQQLDFAQNNQDALAMERVTGEITLAQWRSSTTGLASYLGMGKSARESLGMVDESETFPKQMLTDAKIFRWRFWWSYPDELRSLQGYEVLLGATRFAATNGCFDAALTHQQAGLKALQISGLPDEFTGALFSPEADFHSLISQSIVSLSGTIRKVMTAEAGRRMTVTAIALQRYKLAYGHYPNHLSGLVPEYLESMPLDPVNGQPLHYQRQADGTFLLYSVGENGVDDGGDPAPADHGTPKTFYWLDRKVLDWVWPQATTADDVQFIYTPPAAAK